MYIYIYTHRYSTHPHPDTFIPCLFSSHLFLYSCMMIWFEIRNCLPSIKRDKIFTCQLQQAKDISEKASLGNLCRSSQNLTYKAWCFCSTFLQKKTNLWQKEASNQSFSSCLQKTFLPRDNRDSFQTKCMQPIFSSSERNINFWSSPQVCSPQHCTPPSPSSHTLLETNSLAFAGLFCFSSQKMYCYSVNVFVLSYFADHFLPIFGGLNLPLVTLFAPLWSPLRRLTLSLKKLGQGQTTAWLWTLTSL